MRPWKQALQVLVAFALLIGAMLAGRDVAPRPAEATPLPYVHEYVLAQGVPASGGASTACNSTAASCTVGSLTSTGAVTGSNLSGTNTGDVTLAAVGSSPSANGATLSGQVLTLQPVDDTHPGVVTTGAQTIAGAKTFTSGFTTTGGANVINSLLGGGASGLQVYGSTSTGQHALAVNSNNGTLGAGHMIVGTTGGVGTTFYVDAAGGLSAANLNTPLHTLSTCAAGIEGHEEADILSGAATGKRTKRCLCTSDGASTYKWQNIVTGTLGTTTTCGTE